MKLSRLNRLVHRWGAMTIALPAIVVIVSGIILQLKKESAWIQPATSRGVGTQPSLSFDQILSAAQAVPEAEVKSWDDIDRLDVRPNKGVVKVRCKNRWEVQLDTQTAEVLQVAYRRSDLIEAIHDGSFFADAAKLWVFLPTAVVFAVLWGTGIYLFFQPRLAKRRNRLRRQKTANPT
ncbi:MAG: hypothetical protein Fues2KO_52480 [Fuerstiella sp.]